MSNPITDSKFHMWRTLIAVAHQGEDFKAEEKDFLLEHMKDIAFSASQKAMIKFDLATPQDMKKMFQGVTDYQDRVTFFELARDLVWADGTFCAKEQKALQDLMRDNIKRTDITNQMGKTNLSFEDANEIESEESEMFGEKNSIMHRLYTSFRDHFVKKNKD